MIVWQQFTECARPRASAAVGRLEQHTRARRCVFTVVCDADTCNVYLATSFLCVLVSAVVEHFGNFGVLESPAQIYQRPEDVLVLLDKFLPNGQIG